MNAAQNEIISNLKKWAEKNKDVDCVICAGSSGNKNKIADDLSDLDVVIYARRKNYYDEHHEWLSELGDVAYYYQEPTDVIGVWHILKIYFSNGVRVDLFFWKISKMKLGYHYVLLKEKTILFSVLPGIVSKIIEAQFRFFTKYVSRGFITINDKVGLSPKLAYMEQHCKYRQDPFSLKKFQYTISRFWSHALTTAIYIYRGELMCSKTVGDRIMKQHLLQVIEMYVKLDKGRDYDIFENGRYLEQWAPDFITSRLEDIYGLYEQEDAWRSLRETVNLFSLILERVRVEFPELKFSNPEQHFRKQLQNIQPALWSTPQTID
ncbi:aminoglycoside 6-adenylyltransferase [Chitinophaga sp.]|uniref:aminoglycoside 6-adenylyltransferase n=1 Tax=Chitinophaga sp. TaxID=1869181 RepID=UPI0031D4E6FA